MKKILIIGGTQFIGRNLVNALSQSPEYELCLFNRGITNPDLFPEIRSIKGDRNTSDVSKLGEEDWDFVIDLSCYFPDSLSQILQTLNPRTKRYIFISTCSVYDQENDHSILRDESAAILPCTPTQKTDPSPDTYGNRKAECERVLAASGMDALIFRPALVYGPYDHSDRFYYWLYQVRQHDVLLMPDGGERRFSGTYVGDLVEAILLGLELEGPVSSENNCRVYNVTSFPEISIGEIVEGAAALLGRDPRFVNASPEYLHGAGIRPWVDMPLWLDGDHYTWANGRVLADFGIELGGFMEGLEETIAYFEGLGWPVPGVGVGEDVRLGLLGGIG